MGYDALGGASAAAAAASSRSCAEPLAEWPRNSRVAANSPSLCPTMFSVMYTGMNFFPLCTARVWPTKSGVMVLRRDEVLNTFFSFRSLRARIFTISDSSTYGPFFTLRPMLETPIRNAEFEMRNRWERISHFPFRISHYCVALPRLRPRTMSFVERFFLCRVFLPSTLPHGLVGGRPPELLPSPPPSG